MPTVVVTGARTGLGAEFAAQYRAAEWRVVAPTRAELDVTDPGSIAAFVETLAGTSVDLLVNNAGFRSPEPAACTLGHFAPEAWMTTLLVNTVGPALVTQALIPNMMAGEAKTIVTMSSRLGSFAAGGGANSGGGGSSYAAYRVSKSAVNQVNRCLAIDLGPKGFTCVALNAGWVRTRMGGSGAALTPHDSVAAMRRVIGCLTPSDNGKFINYDGEALQY